ncbi:hypothetical protein V8E53_007483 [Lactarius tabidus]
MADMGDQDRYVHLKGIQGLSDSISEHNRYGLVELSVEFIKRRPTSVLELVFKDETGVKHKSNKFKEGDLLHWKLDKFVRTNTSAVLTIRRALFNVSVAVIEIEFNPNLFVGLRAVALEDRNHYVTVNIKCGRSKSLADVTRYLGSQTCTNFASKVLTFLKLPQLTGEVSQA